MGYQTSSGATAYIPLSELATITLDTGSSLDLSRECTAFHSGQVQRPWPRPWRYSSRRVLNGRIASSIKLPPGYRLIWAGEFGDLQEAKKRLEIIVPISLVLIVGLLYSLFNNLRDCLLALAGIPDAIVGGILALYLSGLNFSISAAIGFVSLLAYRLWTAS